MKYYLLTSTPTRINDQFLKEDTQISCTLPKFDYKNNIVTGPPNHRYNYHTQFYQKIGVDIVTETVFNYPYPFVTEKTFRPMSALRPFIIVGASNTLGFLKNFGFKTFSAIIDESYDCIVDPEKRFISVCNSIKLFVSRPLSQIQRDLSSIEDILLHNQNHLSHLIDCELEKIQQALNDSN